MQTKKRAKSVKFGKSKEGHEIEAKVERKEDQVKRTPDVSNTDLSGADEIKKTIEEKLQAKENLEVDKTTDEKISSKEDAGLDTSSKPAFSSFSIEPEKPASKKRSNIWFFISVVLITFIVGLGLIAGIYYFIKQKPNLPIVLTSPSPTPTISPTPTKEPVDLSLYTLKILNGSGKTGEAAKVESKLSDAGFKVDSVGNAETSDFTKTVIAAKDNVSKEFLAALKGELEKSYEVKAEVGSLTDTSRTDVIVTIGSGNTN